MRDTITTVLSLFEAAREMIGLVEVVVKGEGTHIERIHLSSEVFVELEFFLRNVQRCVKKLGQSVFILEGRRIAASVPVRLI